MVRIAVSIWRDPEFKGLGRMAQWLYLSRITYGQNSEFTPEAAAKWARGADPEEVRRAADELAGTKYEYVLEKAVRRVKIPDRVRREVYAADGWRCVVCGTSENLEIDHIMPVSKGGTDERSNLQTMCAHHNRKKGARIG